MARNKNKTTTWLDVYGVIKCVKCKLGFLAVGQYGRRKNCPHCGHPIEQDADGTRRTDA